MYASPPTRDQVAAIDQRVILRGLSWAQFEAILAARGDRSVPRLTYLEGDLELLAPTIHHARIKTVIARLLEVWALDRGLPLEGYGSWTVRNEGAARGIEPDECYVLGGTSEPSAPDLAIEVVWTHGGLDKLDVCFGLGIGEVWIWEAGQIVVYLRQQDRYEKADRSALFPDLDIGLVARLAELRQQEAIAELRRLTS